VISRSIETATVLCSSYPKLQLSTAHTNIILELSTALVSSKSEIFLKNLVGRRLLWIGSALCQIFITLASLFKDYNNPQLKCIYIYIFLPQVQKQST